MIPREIRTIAMPTVARAVTRPDARGVTPTTLEGYAALYEAPTVIAGMFREVIAPGAFRSALQRGDDVRALFNHDPNFVIGRTASGTLTLREDARGLRYQIALPATTWAADLAVSVGRGDISQSSFTFEVKDETWIAPATPGGLPTRVIRDVALYDVAPVAFPAYEDTSVSARAADANPSAAGAA